MKCQSLRNWVLQCESMQVQTWPKKLVRHVKRCRPCRHFARSVLRLEDRWKNYPLPKAAKKPSAAFLKQIIELENPPTKETPEKPSKRKRVPLAFRPMRWIGAAAAMLLVAIAGIVIMLMSAGQSRANSDVVERLIVWNLEMSNADAKERKRLLEEHDPKFAAELAKIQLTEDDRELAESLLENGRFLASSDDPDEEFENITTIGAELKNRYERAEHKGNERERERCANLYARFIAHDMNPLFERLKQMKPPEKRDGDRPVDKKTDKWNLDKGFFDKNFFDKTFGKAGEKGPFGKSPFGKGPFGKGPFGKGGFEKGGKGDRDREREREREKGDRDREKGDREKGDREKGERGMNREDYFQRQWDERLRIQEAWQKKGVFFPPQLGKKK
jgi:hypothetical protein